ncbi:hypothetical protein H696_02986 [Fonticula alba]|uniref:CobW/HypB/UreG nucleotide-binding domain-containing protein n=1 Tax=Fonticula alba TaxID=691883 RepID=A0A058Z8K5_FONAL|nr:hypothetical protein H696_02986 [Fonticula alba]KCV70629.1 hypothetical protein H696_02986 [Fonticula alba]|eukprot:XP_009495145.1 hypothetical protein H696_02986 [Fonticula alba]
MTNTPTRATAPVSLVVVSGALGSGKTTIILHLLDALSRQGLRIAVLKNEFGDAQVDQALYRRAAGSADSRESSGSAEPAGGVTEVRELANGCMCCTQVGQIEDALRALVHWRPTTAPAGPPDLVFIETSGDAQPASLALELARIAQKPLLPPGTPADQRTGGIEVRLDAVVAVVDCLNFFSGAGATGPFAAGPDGSAGSWVPTPSALLQARLVDLVLLNRIEPAPGETEADADRRLDLVRDVVDSLFDEKPKLRAPGGRVDPALFRLTVAAAAADTAAAATAATARLEDPCDPGCTLGTCDHAAAQDPTRPTHQPLQVLQVHSLRADGALPLGQEAFEDLLGRLPAEQCFRVKGHLWFADQPAERHIYNVAFGRLDHMSHQAYEHRPGDSQPGDVSRLVVIGLDLYMVLGLVRRALGAADGETSVALAS